MDQQLTAFENISGKEEIANNIVGKEEIAHNEQFLLFPQCFLLSQIIVSSFVHILPSYLHFLLNLKSQELAYQVKG